MPDYSKKVVLNNSHLKKLQSLSWHRNFLEANLTDKRTDLWWYVHKIHFRIVFVFFVRQIEREDVIDSQLV